ncbi:MAG: chemotaxis protein CheD [Eubacteriales bacterium]|nr:chemotaxis protein CheD [Lachnospiraceae bacterium]MDO5128114.1 chemotaxis protein CheD [Eubacteriales bacterium]
MNKIVRVGIAQMNICKAPDRIMTVGLGSCIGVVIYDEIKQIAGMVHIMLPDSAQIKKNQNKLKFADTGIDALLDELYIWGVDKYSLKAKIAGGARMFQLQAEQIGNIGDKNIEAVHMKLMEKKIPLIAEDVGLNFGRSIVFDPVTCELVIMTSGKQKKII